MESPSTYKIHEWLHQMRAKIRGQERRALSPKIPFVEYFGPKSPHEQITYTTETVYIVEIPEKEIITQEEVISYYHRNIGAHGLSPDQIRDLLVDHYYEDSLRNEHPALQEAYEKYQSILALVSEKSFNRNH